MCGVSRVPLQTGRRSEAAASKLSLACPPLGHASAFRGPRNHGLLAGPVRHLRSELRSKDLVLEVLVAVPSPLPSQPRGPRREQGFRMPHGAATQREDFQGAGEYAGGATSGLGSAKPPPVGDVAHSSAQEWDPKSPCSNFTHLRIPVSVSTEQLFQAIMQSICQRNTSLQGTVHACVCMCACVCMFV